jgi:glycine/D-amino acid oxidase-like deaminating enzyme
MLVSALWATVLTLAAPGVTTARGAPINEAQVIILGGGITGISLARSLIRDHNVTDILLLEARDELGGRAHTDTLYNSKTGANVTVERGCNWIQGPGKEPILELAEKWGLETARQNYSNVAWWGAPEGENGHFLDLDEQDAFMASYDEFLEQAPTYSGECLECFGSDVRLPHEQLVRRYLGPRRDVHPRLDPSHPAPVGLRVLEHRLHLCSDS